MVLGLWESWDYNFNIFKKKYHFLHTFNTAAANTHPQKYSEPLNHTLSVQERETHPTSFLNEGFVCGCDNKDILLAPGSQQPFKIYIYILEETAEKRELKKTMATSQSTYPHHPLASFADALKKKPTKRSQAVSTSLRR